MHSVHTNVPHYNASTFLSSAELWLAGNSKQHQTRANQLHRGESGDHHWLSVWFPVRRTDKNVYLQGECHGPWSGLLGS